MWSAAICFQASAKTQAPISEADYYVRSWSELKGDLVILLTEQESSFLYCFHNDPWLLKLCYWITGETVPGIYCMKEE